MAIGLSHGGSTIYTSSSRSHELWVATKEGIVALERNGGGWRVSRRMLTDKHVGVIVKEPRSGLVFAGAYHGSIHASADEGETWEPRDNGLTEHDIYSLVCVERDGHPRLYAGTEPAHLYYSDDLGLSWNELAGLRSVPSVPNWKFPVPPHIAHTKNLSFDPFRVDTLYACIEVGGLLRSTDAGRSWVELHGVYEDAHRLLVHPLDPKRVYVVTGRGLYVTSNGGETFEQWISRPSELGNYPDGLVLHPRQPDLMFLSAAQHGPGAWRKTHFAGARISRSKDGGRTWEILRNGLPDQMQASIEALCLEDAGETVSVFAATTAGDVYGSDDAGDHWSRIASGLAPISKGGHYENLAAA